MDYKAVKEQLYDKKLSKAFPPIREKAESMGNWEITDAVESLWNTYKAMLQFMLNGMNDPQSEKIRTEIAAKLTVILLRMERHERIDTQPADKYTSISKSMKRFDSLDSLTDSLENNVREINRLQHDQLVRPSVREYNMQKLAEEHETCILNLFNWTWTSDQWTRHDAGTATRIITSDTLSQNDKAIFLSAVALSLGEFYDREKMLFLLDTYLSPDTLVSQRAMVDIVINVSRYEREILSDKTLTERLQLYKDLPTCIDDFYKTLTQLQLSCFTDNVTTKMRNDILPALMQGHMKQVWRDKNKDTDELTKHGENPEWLEDKQWNASLERKMNEMADLQLDGADVYFGTFAMLKGYPFFNETAHWLYPFDMKSAALIPELSNIINSTSARILKLLLGGTPFCNSDRYSLCFTFKSIGHTDSSLMEEQIESQIKSQLGGEGTLDEILKETPAQSASKTDIRRHYIFDLYRLYNCHPYRLQFSNPFKTLKDTPLTPLNSTIAAMYLDDCDKLQYADFLMRREFHQSAMELFQSTRPNRVDEQCASTWQKIGFCAQKLNRLSYARECYEAANRLKHDSPWTLTRLVRLCVKDNDHAHALEHVENLLLIQPDNTKYMRQKAELLMQLRRYEPALQMLYKISYIEDSPADIQADIVKMLIFTGEAQKARELLDRLPSSGNDDTPLLLDALLKLYNGNIRGAYDTFMTTLDSQPEHSSAIHHIITLIDEIKTAGVVDAHTILLLEDAIELKII